MALGIIADEPAPNRPRENAPSAPPLDTITTPDTNYVYFVVSESEPIPARRIACDASTRLRRIINENSNCDSKGNHLIRDATESEFRQMIEFLEMQKLAFRDQNHRLQIYSLAKHYDCSDLMIYCLREVDANLNASNVLTVYRTLWFYGSLTAQKNPYENRTRGNQKKITYSPEEYLSFLVYNVQQFINMNAESVLLSEEIGHLGFKELENIVKQEDLIINSEMVLINALTRWSREECRRRTLELTHENERRVLGELCYAPRFAIIATRLAPPSIEFRFSMQVSDAEAMRVRISVQKYSIPRPDRGRVD